MNQLEDFLGQYIKDCGIDDNTIGYFVHDLLKPMYDIIGKEE
jgi:hypothetical protein